MKYLLDTNVLSEPLKPEPNRNVMASLERYQSEISTAAPIWHELLFGCQRLPPSRKREMIATYLRDVVQRNMDILPYDDRAAEWHAEQRAKLGLQGLTPSFVDGQIAAIARVNGMTLVTRNHRDFESFDEITILNWHQSA
jgi:tRNA(fMet)-specific endonuclease VapC